MNSPSTRLPRWIDFGLIPGLSLSAALIVGGVIVAVLGESPWAALRLVATGALGSQEGIGYTVFYATNFIFTGLAVAVAYQAGLFNIGAEGQAYMGGLGVGLVALATGSGAAWWVLPATLVGGALFGAAWAFLPGWLQARRGSHVVITTIMFNFLAAALMTYLLVNVLIRPGQQSPETREFGPGAVMPAMHDILSGLGIPFAASPCNAATVLALGAAWGVWVLLWRTRWGFALRVAGANAETAVYAGFSPNRITVGAMALSGALAGCLGLNELLGSQHRILIDFPAGAGYVGIAVALMGRNHPAGVVAAAMLFGALYQGGSQLSFDLPKVNRDMVVVIQGLVILFCGALDNLFRAPLAAWWSRRVNQA